MAKLIGALKIKGKLKSADMTFVEGRNGIYLRSLPKVPTKKSPAFTAQSKRTGTVSVLAGQVNRVFKKYAAADIAPRMYTGLLKRLQKVKPAKRLFWLYNLVELNGHSKKNMRSLGMGGGVAVSLDGRKLTAAVDYSSHPALPKHHFFYRLEMIVAYWITEADEPGCLEQHTKWIVAADKLKGYDFVFDIPEACIDYIVLFRCALAEEKGTKRLPPTNIVQVVDAGSFDEAAVAELKEHFAAKKNLAAAEAQDFSEEDDGIEGR